VGAKHVAALSSGTAAIHLSLILLGVKPGDYVIGTSFTFSATVNPIAYLGATPVLVDSESGTWNMDPELLEEAIQIANRKSQIANIKAIIVAHLYGMPARMKEIMAVADKYGIPVVEDAAEALGSEYMGRRVGCNSKFGILSFNGNKIITTRGGGMLVSDDAGLVARARKLASQAREPFVHYEHEEVGYNYRMSSVLAAIGRGQLTALAERVAAKRRIYERYRDALDGLPGIEFMPEAPWSYSTHWLTVFTIEPGQFGADREQVRRALEAANIESRPVWKPMHLQPVFEGARVIGGAVGERLFANGVCLPSGAGLERDDVARICGVLVSVLESA